MCHKGDNTANLHQCQHRTLPAPQCPAARGRTSHPWLVGQTPPLISSMGDLPSSHSQQSWQAGKLPHSFLPLSHLPCCGSKPIPLPVYILGKLPLGRELWAGFSSVQGELWEGARGCRSGLIWAGILAEFSRTVCTVSSPYNGCV